MAKISKKMVAQINESWGWLGFSATEIVRTNDFGNIIFKAASDGFWRICPEELACKKICDSETDLGQLMANPDFIEDWKMQGFHKMATSQLGELPKGKVFCLKLPAPIGGEYVHSNFGMVDFAEFISFCGDLAFQIKDLPDGQPFNLVFKNLQID